MPQIADPGPGAVRAALAAWPAPVRRRALEVRGLILDEAARTEGVGPLTETLKWGEPAFLTEASGSGSTVRLGRLKAAPERCAVLFNCRTRLLDTFRERHAGRLDLRGDRALVLPEAGPLPEAALRDCLRLALTYHRWRRAR